MSKLSDVNNAEMRIALAERAIAEMATRISELTVALANVAQLKSAADGAVEEDIFIGADEISPFTTGFYQREHDRADRPYRWTGRGDFFEMRFKANRNIEWSFSIETAPNPHIDILALQAFVDYVQVPVEIHENGKLITGTIPQKLFSNTATLTFSLPGSFVPNIIDPMSSDARKLGIVFYELVATPRKLSDVKRDDAVLADAPAAAAPVKIQPDPQSNVLEIAPEALHPENLISPAPETFSSDERVAASLAAAELEAADSKLGGRGARRKIGPFKLG